ncbi:YtxH domain-containing protein [Apibacter muscae]|uniref:YtxH domain-containing protein n=1 Tax=Apibacter muscae TaxID=2509004 RepID=A0A563D942_9FLAO|nr:YtxH domain-containing protein [Apibacter muscae]TWP23164.1 YtxH domain-containing protein [Apibacter muscae]TWP26710.1 YtxH domain-containing protein [Apibacter muscae]TWP27512.1 YtxH domain-containing protein [Apibacter muscae]
MGRKTTSNILASVIFGAAAGLLAGILIAPDKGKITRKKIKDRANDLNENLKDTYHKFKDDFIDGIDKCKHEIHKKKEELVEKITSDTDPLKRS